MTNENVALSFEDLHIQFTLRGQVLKAIRGISLDVYRGESLAIVGESGSGKSVFTKSAMGLLDANGTIAGGHIWYDGRDLAQFKTEKEWLSVRGKEIAMVMQDPMTSLNPLKSVGDQILEAVVLHQGLKGAAAKAAAVDALRAVGIDQPERRYKQYPHEFSGGMRQRVVIAIAVACRPKILICDEPTTALDVTIQAQVIDMMEKLKDRLNTSMILITHDLGIVAEICDQVAIMYAGEIIERGTVYDIFESQRHHPYTEGLFGSIPRLDDETERLKPIKGLMPDPTDLPKGCKFSPRCPQCMDICREKRPPVCRYGSHEISCHLFGQSQEHEGRDEA